MGLVLFFSDWEPGGNQISNSSKLLSSSRRLRQKPINQLGRSFGKKDFISTKQGHFKSVYFPCKSNKTPWIHWNFQVSY